jgi:hypothetical protein
VTAVEKDPRFLPLLAELSEASDGAASGRGRRARRRRGGPGRRRGVPCGRQPALQRRHAAADQMAEHGPAAGLHDPDVPEGSRRKDRGRGRRRRLRAPGGDRPGGGRRPHRHGPAGPRLHPAAQGGLGRGAARPARRPAADRRAEGPGARHRRRLRPAPQDAALEPEDARRRRLVRKGRRRPRRAGRDGRRRGLPGAGAPRPSARSARPAGPARTGGPTGCGPVWSARRDRCGPVRRRRDRSRR